MRIICGYDIATTMRKMLDNIQLNKSALEIPTIRD